MDLLSQLQVGGGEQVIPWGTGFKIQTVFTKAPDGADGLCCMLVPGYDPRFTLFKAQGQSHGTRYENGAEELAEPK